MRQTIQLGVAGARAAAVLVCALAALAVRPQTPVAVPVPSAAAEATAATPQQARSAKPAASVATPVAVTKPLLPMMPAMKGTELDGVVAIVNGDLVLDSDVDEERRFDAFVPYREVTTFSRTEAIGRLINRDLILQQATLQPDDAINDAAVDREIDALRKNIPACREYHCETTAGWGRFLAANGFTEGSLHKRWLERMQVLSFIEQRFRMGIKIEPAEIEGYYRKTMLPQYTKQHATAPPLEAISDRIQEVLLQQRVSSLLGDWLQSLRAQGSVVLLHPGEDAP